METKIKNEQDINNKKHKGHIKIFSTPMIILYTAIGILVAIASILLFYSLLIGAPIWITSGLTICLGIILGVILAMAKTPIGRVGDMELEKVREGEEI